MTRGSSVFRSAALSVATRWADRLIGLISTIILARLLVPEDFGLIVMGSMVIAFADVFLDFGVHVALIKHPSPTQQHYDTAWTLRLIQAAIASTAVVAAAPLAGEFFREPRVVLLTQVMAISLVVSALENIGTLTFQKEMRFGRDFGFQMSKRVAAFLVTIALAFWLRSYWALVFGAMAGRIIGVIISYWIHPMRARIGLPMFRDIFGVSQWMLIRGIGMYLNKKLPSIVVGRREDPGVLGAFSLGGQIASMPTQEFLTPLNRVLFPAFSRVQSNPIELKRIYLLAQAVQTLVGMPAAVGLALLAEEAVRLLLGARWASAVIYVQIFSLIGFVGSITASAGYVLLVLGKTRLLAISTWLQLTVFASLIFVAFPHYGAVEIALLRLALAVIWLAFGITLILKQLEGARFRDIVESIARPVIGCAVMAACIYGVSHLALQGLWGLAAKMGVGGAAYGVTVMTLWWASGRRAGAETYMLEKLREISWKR